MATAAPPRRPGRPARSPAERRQGLRLYLTDQQMEQLAALARPELGISRSQIGVWAIAEYLERHAGEQPGRPA